MKAKLFFLLCGQLIFVHAFAQWTTIHSGTSRALNTLYFPSANTGYVLPYSGPLIRTVDGGNTWDSLSSITLSSDFLYDNHIWFINDSTGFISTHSGTYIKLYKTTDMGNTWINISPADSLNGILNVQFINKQLGFVYANASFDDRFWKTIDGGATWTECTLGFSLGSGTTSLPSMCFVNDSTGFLAGADGSFAYRGTIARSTDSGKTWNRTYLSVNSEINAMNFPTQDTGYIISREGTIYRTNNRGMYWDSMSTINTLTENELFFVSTNTGFVITGSQIYKTTDGALSWDQQNSGTSYHLRKVFFIDANSGYIVGDSGIILRNIIIPSSGYEPKNNHEAITVFPNPSTGKFIFQNGTGKNILNIYDIGGKLILSQKISSPVYTTDLSGYADAVFFYEFITDSGQIIKGKLCKRTE